MKKVILILFGAVRLLYANPDVELLKQQVSRELPFIDGWCSQEKALHFIDLVIAEQPKIWVEIGVFGGSSVLPVASAFKLIDSGIVIAIDPWDKIECIKYYDPIRDSADLKWWGNLNINKIYYSFLNLLKTNQLEAYCKVIRATSEKAASQIESIDVLYIDGNHSEIATLKDVELYLPKVRSNGFIWMNDSTWESRQQAVELLAEQCDVVEMIDNGNCILFKKR